MYKDFYIDETVFYKIKIKQLLYSGYSQYQKIEVFETDSALGRVLALDDVIQVCTGDYYNYHQGFVEPALKANPDISNTLIVGGGDGVMAKFLIDSGIQDITQVEIDQKVINVCNQYFTNINDCALDKINLFVTDGIKFVKRSKDKYDLILCDLTDSYDENNSSFKIFTDDFFKDVKKIMNDKSIIIFQTDLPFWWDEQRVNTLQKVGSHFNNCGSYVTPVHSYGGMSSFVWASDESIITDKIFNGVANGT